MSADPDFHRSERIQARWTDGYKPTFEEKGTFWRAYARDVAAGFKSNTAQIVHAISCASWAWAKANKAETHIADLERRLRALELRVDTERKGFFYRGVWQDGQKYEEGDFVTDHGGLWHCNAATLTRPGSCDAWQLAVKSGDRRR